MKFLPLLLLSAFVIILNPGCSAQSKTISYAEATFAFGKYQGSLSAQFVHIWKVGAAKRFGIGSGIRATSYLGANQYYITAPAKLTSESTSPLIFFKENIVANIDSLLIQSPQVTALNLSIHLDYSFSSRFTVGFNIDALGFSFGAQKKGNYINGVQGKITEGKPTSFNVLLISDNDRGSLNSELYGRFWLNERWALKAGAQFLFTEYTTRENVQTYPMENDRFRRKSFLFGVGTTYRL